MTDDGLIDIGEVARRMRAARRGQAVASTVAILAVSVGLSMLFAGYGRQALRVAIWMVVPVMVVEAALKWFASSTARALVAAESPYAIPDLVGQLQLPSAALRQRRRELLRMLARATRKMQSEDASRLSGAEADSLYTYLDVSQADDHVSVQLAIVDSLRATKDTRALERVRHIASTASPRAKTGAVIRVEEAVREVLPLLESQKRIEDEAGSLLRPSEAQCELLRPAQSTPRETEELLRSVPKE